MKTLAFLLLFAATAFGQTNFSTVRIYKYQDEDNEPDGMGSGWVVTPTQVVTAYHVVHKHRVGDKQVQIRFSDGSRSWGTVEATSLEHDLALIWINKTDVAPIPAGSLPELGKHVSIHGYGFDYEYKTNTGTLVNRVENTTRDYDTMAGSVKSDPEGAWQAILCKGRFGDSGGPVTYNGKVIGVVLSITDRVTVFCRIDTLLEDFKGKFRRSVLKKAAFDYIIPLDAE